jgi:hypothetical protein
MKHETKKKVSSTRYKKSQSYHNKSKKIYKKNKQKQCEIGLKNSSPMQGLNMTYNPHVSKGSQRISI